MAYFLQQREVTGSVPQGPALFSIFLNDLEKRVIIKVTKFADDAELFMATKTKADHEELWKALMILCD